MIINKERQRYILFRIFSENESKFDQKEIMKETVRISELLAAPECGFTDSQLVLIHQADNRVSMGDLPDFTPDLAASSSDLDGGAGFMVLSGNIFEMGKKFPVTGVGDHDGPVF